MSGSKKPPYDSMDFVENFPRFAGNPSNSPEKTLFLLHDFLKTLRDTVGLSGPSVRTIASHHLESLLMLDYRERLEKSLSEKRRHVCFLGCSWCLFYSGAYRCFDVSLCAVCHQKLDPHSKDLWVRALLPADFLGVVHILFVSACSAECYRIVSDPELLKHLYDLLYLGGGVESVGRCRFPGCLEASRVGLSPTKRCKGCLRAEYCGAECQKNDRGRHKTACRILSERSDPMPSMGEPAKSRERPPDMIIADPAGKNMPGESLEEELVGISSDHPLCEILRDIGFPMPDSARWLGRSGRFSGPSVDFALQYPDLLHVFIQMTCAVKFWLQHYEDLRACFLGCSRCQKLHLRYPALRGTSCLVCGHRYQSGDKMHMIRELTWTEYRGRSHALFVSGCFPNCARIAREAAAEVKSLAFPGAKNLCCNRGCSNGGRSRMRKCSGCELATYCDEKCMRKAWKGHKEACRILKPCGCAEENKEGKKKKRPKSTKKTTR